MESIQDVNKQFKTNDLERALLSDYVVSLKDPDFKKLVTRLKLSENVAMKYTAKLEMTCEELKNCSKCKGLGNCKNKVKGCVYYPNVDGNIVMFDYVACKYRKEQIEQANKEISLLKSTFEQENKERREKGYYSQSCQISSSAHCRDDHTPS
mgnify:CR=1 FL=1